MLLPNVPWPWSQILPRISLVPAGKTGGSKLTSSIGGGACGSKTGSSNGDWLSNLVIFNQYFDVFFNSHLLQGWEHSSGRLEASFLTSTKPNGSFSVFSFLCFCYSMIVQVWTVVQFVVLGQDSLLLSHMIPVTTFKILANHDLMEKISYLRQMIILPLTSQLFLLLK